MLRYGFCLALGLALLTSVGCGKFGGQGDAATGGVAVIDLDEVAKKLGRDVEMANSIKQTQDSLNQQLTGVQNSFKQQLEEKRESLSPEPTEEETKQLVGMQQQANTRLNQAVNQAKTALGQHRAKVVRDFRTEAQPVALEVAQEKGLSIVVTKNDSVVFGYVNAVDITGEVVDRMKLMPRKAAARTATLPSKPTEKQ